MLGISDQSEWSFTVQQSTTKSIFVTSNTEIARSGVRFGFLCNLDYRFEIQSAKRVKLEAFKLSVSICICFERCLRIESILPGYAKSDIAGHRGGSIIIGERNQYLTHRCCINLWGFQTMFAAAVAAQVYSYANSSPNVTPILPLDRVR